MAKNELNVANFISHLIKDRQNKVIVDLFAEFNDVDLAQVIEQLSVNDAFILFKILPKEQSGDIFSYLSPETQEQFISKWTGQELKDLLDNLSTDDIADFIDDMPDEIANKILKAADPSMREDINLLLSYKENSCGSIMTTNYMELSSDDTIGTAMRKLQQQGRNAETANLCYVTDSSNTLLGAISLRKVLFSSNSLLVKDVMETDLISVKTSDDQETAVEEMKKYDLGIIPVVDNSNKMLGVITSDDVLDVMQAETTEDIQLMAGITPVETPYLQTNIFKLASSRLPWLLLLMLSASLSGWIMGKNEVLLVAYPILNSFVPMLMDTGGNAGSQSSTMVTRGITVDHLDFKSAGEVLFKELRTAIICGAVLFVINMLRVMIFMPSVAFMINLSVSITIFAVVLAANMVGGLLPLVATLIHVDPAVMASPLITTVVDAMSLTIFFLLVSILL